MRMNATAREKVALFRDLFSGQNSIYGTYDPASGKCWQVKKRVTDAVIWDHLLGRRPYGVYLLVGNRTRSVVADFDLNDLGPVLEYHKRADHYGLEVAIERSKSKGYHAWLFFEGPGVGARPARLVVREILREIGCPEVEVFPKQDALSSSVQHGSFINAPLFGRLTAKGRTVFLSPETLEPYDDQWEFLRTVQKASSRVLQEAIDINGWGRKIGSDEGRSEQKPRFTSWGLPPCARKMLEEGVESNQRMACFRQIGRAHV